MHIIITTEDRDHADFTFNWLATIACYKNISTKVYEIIIIIAQVQELHSMGN